MRRTLGFYDVHDDDCLVWDIPLDEQPECTCPGERRLGGTLPVHAPNRRNYPWASIVADMLNTGHSRQQMSDALGVQWESILMRALRDPELQELHKQLLRLSQLENDIRIAQQYW